MGSLSPLSHYSISLLKSVVLVDADGDQKTSAKQIVAIIPLKFKTNPKDVRGLNKNINVGYCSVK